MFLILSHLQSGLNMNLHVENHPRIGWLEKEFGADESGACDHTGDARGSQRLRRRPSVGLVLHVYIYIRYVNNMPQPIRIYIYVYRER